MASWIITIYGDWILVCPTKIDCGAHSFDNNLTSKIIIGEVPLKSVR